MPFMLMSERCGVSIAALVVSSAMLAPVAWAQTATAVPASKSAAARDLKASPQSSQAEVEAVLRAQRVVADADGKESLVDARSAGPGETVEYTVTYRSKAKAAVKDLEATLPVPEGMQFVPATARPGLAMATTDGKTFQLIPLKRKVKGPDGKEVEREVPVEEYKAIRWKLGELQAGKQTNVTARMRLNPLDVAPAVAKK